MTEAETAEALDTIMHETSKRIRNSLERDDRGERCRILNDVLDEHGYTVNTETWEDLLSAAEKHAEMMDDLLGSRYAGTEVNPA